MHGMDLIYTYPFFHCITVESVDTSVEKSRDPPFYVDTSLNLRCKVDLPNTVDPNIITFVQLVENDDYYYYSFPIDVRLDHSSTYQCRICLVISDDKRYSTTCSFGKETYIRGKLNLHKSLLSVLIILLQF